MNFPKALLGAATLFATLLVSGCPRGDGSSSGRLARERRPLKPPRKRLLEREAEAAVMDLMADLRGDGYLRRIKAEEDLDELTKENPVAVAPYLVQLLDEPQLGIRVAVIRMFMNHGRRSPEAVETLVEVTNDPGQSLAIRDHAARTLRGWTGLDFGYRAWTDPGGVKYAAKRWKRWLDETDGVIPPPLDELGTAP